MTGSGTDRGWAWTMGVVWASQGLSIMGFSFAFPFVPFFLQEDLVYFE